MYLMEMKLMNLIDTFLTQGQLARIDGGNAQTSGKEGLQKQEEILGKKLCDERKEPKS